MTRIQRAAERKHLSEVDEPAVRKEVALAGNASPEAFNQNETAQIRAYYPRRVVTTPRPIEGS